MGQGNFDLVASFYPLLEQLVFGSTLNQARQSFAREIGAGKEILLIGEGNGRFLCEMMKQTASASSFTVIDSSARMLAAAGRRIAPLTSKQRIEWIGADFLKWHPPGALYDRVVTHFFLDLFRPDRICQIVEKISRITTEDGLWVNVDFTPDGRGLHQKMLMWAQYGFFRRFAGIEASRLFDARLWIRQGGWKILEERSLRSGWISGYLMRRGCTP
jgi:ubiquinone/menaquinone biosynthesis C-methylase UbiE